MNKIMIIAAATAAVATYVLARRRANKTVHVPEMNTSTTGSKHLTDVFARAKKTNMSGNM